MSAVASSAHTRMRFIVNPRSGTNARHPGLLERVQQFVDERPGQACLVLTERAGHASDLAQAAVQDGCGVVVAVGGDGTMNQVAGAVMDTPAVLGLVPCGSGNGLGRHLGIRTADAAFSALAGGTVRQIDAGTVNGQPFFNTMGLGFDVEIAHRFNQLVRRGLPAYITTTLAAWNTYRRDRYVIEDGLSRIESEAFLVSVANSDQYGNDCYIAPGARVDDGLLDLTLLRRIHALNALPLAARLFLERLVEGSDVVRLRSAGFRITRAQPGLIHTDGEVHEAPAELDVRVRPRALRVLVPPATAPPPPAGF